jgi:hypothetical protein
MVISMVQLQVVRSLYILKRRGYLPQSIHRPKKDIELILCHERQKGEEGSTPIYREEDEVYADNAPASFEELKWNWKIA